MQTLDTRAFETDFKSGADKTPSISRLVTVSGVEG
jgi:hypothetical protein